MTYRASSRLVRVFLRSSFLLLSSLALAWGITACGAESQEEQEPVTGENPGRTTGYPDSMGGSAGDFAPLGDACVPASENDPNFAGASLDEVILETVSECGPHHCLSNHFQGRVSCPYGQNLDAVDTLSADDPARCRLPESPEPVEVAVPPQLVNRLPEDAVYCSCRCDGPDPDAGYCLCPEGMHCEELIEDTGSNPGVAGSYCVKDGTDYQEDENYGPPCTHSNPDAAEVCGGGNP